MTRIRSFHRLLNQWAFGIAIAALLGVSLHTGGTTGCVPTEGTLLNLSDADDAGSGDSGDFTESGSANESEDGFDIVDSTTADSAEEVDEDIPSGAETDFEEFAYGDPEEELYEDSESEGSSARSTPTYQLPFFSGETYSATTYNSSAHVNAWDFNLSGSSDCGEPAVAVTNGTVNVAQTVDNGGLGKYVRIQHNTDANKSYYAHLSEVYVVLGQWVEEGQVVGRIGSTGNSSGCHLHFEVRNPSNQQIRTRFHYTSGGQLFTGYLNNGSSYTSWNHGKITAARTRNGGAGVVGNASLLASRVDYEGFAAYFSGGSLGPCAIYYQALGCAGTQCAAYNNTNYAWLVRYGFYNYYSSCGGPTYCWLGFPTSDEFGVSGGTRQNYEFGYLTWTPSQGVIGHSY